MYKSPLLNVSLILCSTGVCLLGCEIAFRFFQTGFKNYNFEMWRYAKEIKVASSNLKIGHEHAPNRSGIFYGATITTNSIGFRDKEYSLEKDKYRLAILGDSVTMGWGVEEQDTFATRLESTLNQENEWIDIINMGVGNYNTQMEVEAFLEKGAAFRPNAILVAYFINDAEIVKTSSQNILRNVFESSFAYGIIAGKLLDLKYRFGTASYLDYYRQMYEPGSMGCKIVEDSLRTLKKYTDKEKIELQVAIIPELHNLKEYPFQNVTEYVHSLGRKYSFRTFDVLPYLEAEKPTSLWVSYEDAHPNAKAHALIAKAIHTEMFQNEKVRDLVSKQSVVNK